MTKQWSVHFWQCPSVFTFNDIRRHCSLRDKRLIPKRSVRINLHMLSIPTLIAQNKMKHLNEIYLTGIPILICVRGTRFDILALKITLVPIKYQNVKICIKSIVEESTINIYRKTSNIRHTLVAMKLSITQMYLGHRLTALLQLHLHSRLDIWLQGIRQRKPQDSTRIF